MRAAHKLVATILLMSSLAFAVFAIWPQPLSGDTGPQKVQVVNTPLPVSVQGPATVSGNVGITGTANVNVTGLPTVSASQSGSWTVGLADGVSVNVGNTASNPVPVNNIDMRIPVMLEPQVTTQACDSSAAFFEVPADKRLVIESITAEARTHVGQVPLLHVRLGFNSSPVPLQLQVSNLSGVDYWLASYQTRAYVEPGRKLSLDFCRSDFTSLDGALADVLLAGYLIPR